MGKFFTALSRLPRRFSAIVAIALAAVILPATLWAWGPDRPTYTEQHPADHITFNSITNNSFYGDERNFTTIKDAANTAPGGWKDTVTAQPGKEYQVRMYVHNNAADNLHLVASNVRATAAISTSTGKNVAITGYINADNANPGEIYDDVNLVSDKNFNLVYVPGSAKFHNNKGNFDLPDTITGSNGALLGYDKMDGKIPGCYKYSGWVYFKVKPQFGANPNFTTSKYVSKHGANKWVKSYEAAPGETVDYLINYKNTGDTQQDNVTLKDALPAGVSYENDSTVLHNALHPQGSKSSDNITKVGINIGSYTSGSNAWVTFSAKVAANDVLPKCGKNLLKNVVRTTASGYYKEDSADVSVNRECQPPANNYSCDGLAVAKIERVKFKFTTNTTEENAQFKKVVYVIRNAKGVEVERKESTAKTFEYVQAKPGNYTVQADVTFMVNGVEKVVSGDNCKKPFKVTSNECKPGIPAGDERCKPYVCKPSSANNNCLPEELPHTGAGDNLVALLGIGSLVAAIGYYITSRRSL